MSSTIFPQINIHESSSGVTDEWKSTYRKICSYLKRILKDHTTAIKLSRGHFEMSGFFQVKSTGQIWYINIGDVRGPTDKMLIRTTTSFTDYTGGSNQYLNIKNSDFANQLIKLINS